MFYNDILAYILLDFQTLFSKPHQYHEFSIYGVGGREEVEWELGAERLVIPYIGIEKQLL